MWQRAQGAGTVPVLQTRTGFLTRYDRILGEIFFFFFFFFFFFSKHKELAPYQFSRHVHAWDF